MPRCSTVAISRRQLIAVLVVVAALPAILMGSSRAAAPVFAEPISLQNGGVSEPGIDVGPDGTVFVNGIMGLPTHSRAWRSTDGGSSFEQLVFNTPYNRFPGGGDSDVAVGDGGRVYFLDLSAVSNSLARSDDNGTTWSEGTPFTTLPVSDRQWIALGNRDANGEDTVYAVYHFIQPPSNLMFARSRDSGLTWDWHTAPYGLGGALPGQLVADGDFVAFNYENQGTMYLLRSFDAGTTWERHQVTLTQEATLNITAVALDGDDMYIAWVNRFDYSVRVARSRDRGATWTTLDGDGNEVPDIQTVSTGGTAMFPWVAARDGKVAVTWYGADDASGDPNRVPASTEWTLKYVETLDWASGFTAPVDASHGVVKRGIICTAGIACTAGRELGDFQQVTIDGEGKSLISYVDLVCDPFCRGANVVKQL